MDVDLKHPNPVLTERLLSPRMRDIVFERAETAQWLYQGIVHRRTGALANTARALTEIGGARRDRWIGVLLIGVGLEYGAAEEFGHIQGGSVGTRGKFVPGVHDLNTVLEELETL